MNNFFSLIIIFATFFTRYSVAIEPNRMVQDLVNQAVEKKIADHRAWKKLLHYQPNLFFVTSSQVKDPAFFLAAEGHKNSELEMVRTLESFFAPVELKDKHSICRFPARLFWLKEKLKDHSAWNELPKPICYYLDVYQKNLNAESISYVFSSYYANNPGSAFGHTFFRVNKKSKVGKAKQELLDYGISYAAQVTTGNTLLYMFNGLTGVFKGSYVSVPYYYKVREYNDYESRDLWAYELNLSDAEVTQVVNHLWELGPHYFDYYFFTQNCSFHMLTVIEAASDRIDLIDKVPLYVIPSDSVKALFEVPGLVRKSEFRPSLRKHFESKWNQLRPQEKNAFVSSIENSTKEGVTIEKINNLIFESKERKAIFYDTLIDYVDMKDPKGIAGRSGSWHTIKEFLLINRAEIPVISEDSVIPTPELERPEKSHPSARVSIGIGRGSGVSKSTTPGYFHYRFAFHDLLDNSTGLPNYSQLEFFNFKFQFVEKDLNIDSFSFFNILQLNPIRKVDPQLSWGMDSGLKSMNLCGGSRSCLGIGLQGYVGYAASSDKQLFWVLPFFHYRYGKQFSGIPNYLAGGYQLGYLLEWSQRLKLISKYVKEIPNRFEVTDELSISGRYNFSYKQALEIEWRSEQLSKFDDSQVSKIFYHYFF